MRIWEIGVLLISATIGMGGLVMLWWYAFVRHFFGDGFWTAPLIFDRFNEQWVEGILFNGLLIAVVVIWVRLIIRAPRRDTHA